MKDILIGIGIAAFAALCALVAAIQAGKRQLDEALHRPPQFPRAGPYGRHQARGPPRPLRRQERPVTATDLQQECSWCFALGEPMSGDGETAMCLDPVTCTQRAAVLLQDVLATAPGASR